MKTFEQYRRTRQSQGITLADLAAESNVDKGTLLRWEVGGARLMRSDVRRIFLALKSLIGKRGVRSWRCAVNGRSELRAKPKLFSSFSHMGTRG